MRISDNVSSILVIDLTSRKVTNRRLNPELAKTFIGGWGIMNKLAYDLIPPDVDPLAPENLIIIGVGIFAGTSVPGATKLLVATKFPMNNTFAVAAGGGNFARMLRSNGYDYAVICGRASYPVYLNITENSAEICDASHLWGRDNFETVDELRRIYPLSSIIPIGPAGENLVKISVTAIDKGGTLGSGGLPAIMGSKKLKAIVVQEGNKEVEVAHPARIMSLVNNLYDRMLKWSGRETLMKYGAGPMPTSEPLIIYNNWNDARTNTPSSEDKRAIAEMHAQSRRPLACPGCSLAEKERVDIKESEGKSLTTYLTQFANRKWVYFTGADSAAAEYYQETKYQDAANRYGICIHSFRNALTLMAYLYQNGVISKEETDGMELSEDWNTAFNLMRLTAYREGLGNILAEGALGAARIIGRGSEDYVVHSKGRTIVVDPRLSSLGTTEFEQTTNPRGSHVFAGGSPSFTPGRPLKDFERHCQRMDVPDEAVKRIIGSTTFNVGRLTRYSEDWSSLFNVLGLCNLPQINRFYDARTITALYSAVTGNEVTPAELMRCAERAWTLFKLLNVRVGFSRKDDEAPPVWFKPLRTREDNYVMTDYYKTKALTKQDLESLLDDYYDERGYDIKTGIPTPQKLRELGLCYES